MMFHQLDRGEVLKILWRSHFNGEDVMVYVVMLIQEQVERNVSFFSQFNV